MTTASKMKTVNSKKPSIKSKKLSKNTSLEKVRLRSFERKILDFCHKESLWQPKQSLLLAISGGPDSICLLFTLLALAKKEGLKLSLAHIDHNIREKESLKDSLFVENLAKKYSLPFYKTTLPRKKSASEENLRALRYAFLEKLQSLYSFDHIVLGHHADDQAETFLLRLLRGSGLDGLKSMQPRNGIYIRPLLLVWKRDILRYLKENGIPYRIDKSNKENLYLRNRVRNRLIPYLEKNYQPNIKTLLVQTAELLRESSTPQITIPSVGVLYTKDSLTFSLDSFRALTREEQPFFLRQILATFLPQPISRRLLLEILKMLESTKNKTPMMTFHGLKLSKKGVTVTLQKNLSD